MAENAVTDFLHFILCKFNSKLSAINTEKSDVNKPTDDGIKMISMEKIS